MPDKVITKAALRNLRKKLKMTQVEFAEYIGVSRHTVESWEQGRLAIPKHLSTNPKTEHLTKR